MHEAVGQTANPQTAIAIAKQVFSSERVRRKRERIWFGFPIDESLYLTIDNDQECPVEVFTKTLVAGCRACNSKELRRTRFPSPQPVLALGPDVPLTVLVQVVNPFAKRAVLSVAASVAVVNRTKFSGGRRRR